VDYGRLHDTESAD